MARGGRREGTPGTVYGQRTDLNAKRSLDTGYTPPTQPMAPTGGGPPPTAGGPTAPPAEQMGVHPDTVTELFAPTDRPDEPVTAGLAYGPGSGPSTSGSDQHRADLMAMARHLPWLTKAIQGPDVPLSVINFVTYLQSQVPR